MDYSDMYSPKQPKDTPIRESKQRFYLTYLLSGQSLWSRLNPKRYVCWKAVGGCGEKDAIEERGTYIGGGFFVTICRFCGLRRSFWDEESLYAENHPGERRDD